MPVNAEQNQINQQNKDNTQNGQNPISLTSPGGNQSSAGAANSGRVASFSSGTAPQQANSSGRYTNLSKYINNTINNNLEPQKQEAQTQANAVKEGISGANTSLNKGAGYLSQLGNKDFNAQNFASDQNQLQDFTKFRTGQAVDTNQLGTLNNQAQTTNQSLQNTLQNRQNQVSNEQGRFQLLNESFGGGALNKNPYSTGQQRLDQLFFQAQGPSNITNLQNNINSNLNTAQQGMKTLTDQYGNDITGIGTQQKDLAGNLQNTTNQMGTGYITGLQDQVGGINSARDALRQKYGDFTNQLISSAQGVAGKNPLDQGLMDEAQLHAGEQVFNTFNNLDPHGEQFVNYDKRNAADYHNIANQGNVDYYNALAQLAGNNNSALNAENSINSSGSLIDPKTGQLTTAAALKQGEGSIRSAVDTSRNNFLNNAVGSNFTGTGDQSYYTGLFNNSKHTANASASDNALRFLTGGNTNTIKQLQESQNAGTYNPLNNTLAGADLSHFNQPLQDAASFINDRLGASVWGDNSGEARRAASQQAQEGLNAQLNSYLNNSGFNNYLGASGVAKAPGEGITAANQDLFGYRSGNNLGYMNGYNAPKESFAGETRSEPMTAEEALAKFAQQNQAKS
jgi:hypothetical protein